MWLYIHDERIYVKIPSREINLTRSVNLMVYNLLYITLMWFIEPQTLSYHNIYVKNTAFLERCTLRFHNVNVPFLE